MRTSPPLGEALRISAESYCMRGLRPVANPCLLRDRSVYVVQVSPANRAEREQRIGIEALGQRLLRELSELDTRFQRNLNEGSEHRLCAADDMIGSKKSHSVEKPDQALLVTAEFDVVAGVSVQQKIRRAHNEFAVNGLPFRHLR